MIDLKNITLKEKIDLFKSLYKEIAGKGIEGDTELAHINPFEADINLSTVLFTGCKNPVAALFKSNPIKLFNRETKNPPYF